jgi:hypothetical protein
MDCLRRHFLHSIYDAVEALNSIYDAVEAFSICLLRR